MEFFYAIYQDENGWTFTGSLNPDNGFSNITNNDTHFFIAPGWGDESGNYAQYYYYNNDKPEPLSKSQMITFLKYFNVTNYYSIITLGYSAIQVECTNKFVYILSLKDPRLDSENRHLLDEHTGVIFRIPISDLDNPDFNDTYIIHENIFLGQQARLWGYRNMGGGSIGALMVVDENDNIYIERNNIIVRLPSK